ncbi:MAG: hypothetical protein R3B96_03335 [Pirellulaceae bacterium]
MDYLSWMVATGKGLGSCLPGFFCRETGRSVCNPPCLDATYLVGKSVLGFGLGLMLTIGVMAQDEPRPLPDRDEPPSIAESRSALFTARLAH